MNKPLTIKQLKTLCEKQIKLGNGNKVIMISDDDEGNGYHYLWYAFISAKELGLDEDFIETKIANLDNTMVLG